MLDNYLKERVKTYAEERGVKLSEEQIEHATKGVRFAIDEVLEGAIDDALTSVLPEEEFWKKQRRELDTAKEGLKGLFGTAITFELDPEETRILPGDYDGDLLPPKK